MGYIQNNYFIVIYAINILIYVIQNVTNLNKIFINLINKIQLSINKLLKNSKNKNM